MFKFDANDPEATRNVRIAMALIVTVILGQYGYAFYEGRRDALAAGENVQVTEIAKAKEFLSLGDHSSALDIYM